MKYLCYPSLYFHNHQHHMPWTRAFVINAYGVTEYSQNVKSPSFLLRLNCFRCSQNKCKLSPDTGNSTLCYSGSFEMLTVRRKGHLIENLKYDSKFRNNFPVCQMLFVIFQFMRTRSVCLGSSFKSVPAFKIFEKNYQNN